MTTADIRSKVTPDVWIFAIATAVLAALLLRVRGGPDIDLWLHLRIGDELLSGERFGRLPDPLVVAADQPYHPTQWLAEVLGSVVFNIAGLVGIRLLRVLALVILVTVVYLTARQFASQRAAGVITLLVTFGTSAAWGERPQLAGLFLYAIVVLLWARAWRTGTVPWLVAPLFWVWAFLHGSWILGLATGVVMTVVVLLGGRPRVSVRPLIAVNVLSVAVITLTPLGPALLLEPFRVGEAASQGVNEWQPPAPDNPLLVVIVVIAVFVLVRSARRLSEHLGTIVITLFAVGLAVSSVRTLAFASVLIGLALARRVGGTTSAGTGLSRRELGPWLAAVAMLAVVPGATLGSPPPPLNASVSAALRALPPGTHIVVDPWVSGWVLHAHPDLTPVQDLRTEVYSSGVLLSGDNFWKAAPGWQSYLAGYHADAVLASTDSPVDGALRGAGWVLNATGSSHDLWTRSPAP